MDIKKAAIVSQSTHQIMAKLYFNYSSMNAGKSTMLLQANHNYLERGMKPQIYTSDLDNRFGQGEIVSRIGLKEKSNMTSGGNININSCSISTSPSTSM